MSIDALKAEVRALATDERRKLMAFMVGLEDEGRPGYAAALARRIDGASDRWLTAEECERRLGLRDEAH